MLAHNLAVIIRVPLPMATELACRHHGHSYQLESLTRAEGHPSLARWGLSMGFNPLDFD